jgi:hypothetical protein
MPLQNRVTPFGDIVSIPQRGIFTGNRGIIHDPASKTLLNKRWAAEAWLICECRYKDIHRDVMAARSWTELFFLDEAIALAAGHRPCFLCRREKAEGFRCAWASGNHVAPPAAKQLDKVLHRERLDHGRKRLHPLIGTLRALPAGTVVSTEGQAFTVANGMAFRWTDQGYATPVELLRAEWLVTPPSTLMALKAGYRPVLHPSITTTYQEN